MKATKKLTKKGNTMTATATTNAHVSIKPIDTTMTRPYAKAQCVYGCAPCGVELLERVMPAVVAPTLPQYATHEQREQTLRACHTTQLRELTLALGGAHLSYAQETEAAKQWQEKGTAVLGTVRENQCAAYLAALPTLPTYVQNIRIAPAIDGLLVRVGYVHLILNDNMRFENRSTDACFWIKCE